MIRHISKWLLSALLVSAFILLSASAWVLGNKKSTAQDPADCAVVFGAAVWRGAKPSHALFDRTLEGIRLYQSEQVDCLIFSGADTEPDVMNTMAIKAEIPDQDIYLDYQGLNTLATLENLDNEKSYILVSNDFHLGRIRMLAWKLDLQSQPHAATYNQGRYLKETFFTLREIIATIWYTLRFDI